MAGQDLQTSAEQILTKHMKKSKILNTLTIVERRILAVLILVIALTNSQVSTAQAAEPILPVDQPVFTGTIAFDDVTIDAVTLSEVTPTPEETPTVQEVLLKVCAAKGYGQDCAKTLLGMLWNESSNIYNAIGDGGRARGYFQIHYKLHNIPVACAEDLVCSANWSLNYLESNSYPRYASYAVQCHNSCNVNNGYAARALRHGNYFWNKPLEVKQAAPIELTVK